MTDKIRKIQKEIRDLQDKSHNLGEKIWGFWIGLTQIKGPWGEEIDILKEKLKEIELQYLKNEITETEYEKTKEEIEQNIEKLKYLIKVKEFEHIKLEKEKWEKKTELCKEIYKFLENLIKNHWPEIKKILFNKEIVGEKEFKNVECYFNCHSSIYLTSDFCLKYIWGENLLESHTYIARFDEFIHEIRHLIK